MPQFRKYLVVSQESSRFASEEYLLEKITWSEVERHSNFSDYDGIGLNLDVLNEISASKSPLYDHQIRRAFDAKTWAHIVAAGGQIIVVGYPGLEVVGEAMAIRTVNGVLEYRRIVRNDEEPYKTVYNYLDRVTAWTYSIRGLAPSVALKKNLDATLTQVPLGLTTFETALAVRLESVARSQTGSIMFLPSIGKEPELSDMFVVREWFGIAGTLSEPDWLAKLQLPGEAKTNTSIKDARNQIQKIEGEIATSLRHLSQCRKWYRLLYEDGLSLEQIVKEAFEALGAKVTKASKEKDDYRLKTADLPEAILEVKGTHNPKFGVGPLRQLSGWIDEATAADPRHYVGIFVGNSHRKEQPHLRAELFEDNAAKFAVLKAYVTIRTIDLYCLVVLQQLDLLDVPSFWKTFLSTKGAFDSSAYFKALPTDFSFLGTKKK